MRYVALFLMSFGVGLILSGGVALANGGGGPTGRVTAGCNCTDCAPAAPKGCRGQCAGSGCLAACGCNDILVPQCNCNR
jgi:hypothetical protein